MRSRMMRLSAATLLVGAAAATVAPHATSYISSSAIVNAPLLAVSAPFDGVLVETSGAFATAVASGQRLLRVEAERQDQDALAAVQAEIGAIRAQIAAVEAQLATVLDLEGDLRARVQIYEAALGRYLDIAHREASAALDRAEIHRQQVWGELIRVTRLAENGAASQVALESLQAQHQMAAAQVTEAAARRDALDVQAQSLGSGIAFDGAIDGGIYARQRLDEVTLQMAELNARRETLSGRLVALEAQESAIAADFARRTTFEPVAVGPAVVWRAAPAEGVSVAAGGTLMQLLDCGNRFVEVALPGRLFERIRPGDSATVLFKGAEATVGARVEAVGGAGARFNHPSLASDPPEISDGDIQVLVRLEPADPVDPAVAASFCDVGRSAEVRFARSSGSLADRIASAASALGERVWQLLPTGTEVGDLGDARPGQT